MSKYINGQLYRCSKIGNWTAADISTKYEVEPCCKPLDPATAPLPLKGSFREAMQREIDEALRWYIPNVPIEAPPQDPFRGPGLVRALLETGPGIAAKSLAPEPWRPSCPDDFWIPDVGEHGERKP